MEATPQQVPNVVTQESLNELRRGITAMFARWTAARIALEERFGGRETESIIHDMLESCIRMASVPLTSRFDGDRIVDLLYDGFDNMSCDIEDGSIEEMATMICNLREECLVNANYRSVQKLVNMAQTDRNSIMSMCVRLGNNDDDNEEDAGEGEAGSSTMNNRNEDGASSLMQLDDASQNDGPREPEVDEDGFMKVVPKRGRRKPA